ncbi:HlyD family type I secretion periplasmic adaptor subunit [Aureimonas endophytica]|uniref:Membrane fusion protein (MFP) family protein n=1 Tax=Aureimonas endophytica TaxID=2027858 RepID=A0A917E319_9HYPH|nr:HlyD family type I secretion periplasmic adaptor subunit [Aureimonas endophytica]GGD95591.1 HlyD family type I secretion periplasmic adaptor subunit [Aureimonas endophytica]
MSARSLAPTGGATTGFHDIEWYADVPRSIGRQTVLGLLLLVVTFGGFSIWAFTAPLAAAIITQGSFVATGQNKIVQHFGGGIIKDLLVGEGDHVTAGQPLIRLDETAALANERQIYLRRMRLEAIVARLKTDVASETPIAFPPPFAAPLADADVQAIKESQETSLASTRAKLNSEVGLLRQNIASLDYRIAGYGEQTTALKRQLALLKEEFAGKNELFRNGLLRRTELAALQRAMADAEGQIGRLDGESGETRAQIDKLDQQITQARQTYRQQALDELQNAAGELDSVREQSVEARNVLQRTTVQAPASGTVVRMYYHSAGGVIESGKPIMEILPSDVPLIIETQIPRTDIDLVKVSEKASVRLTALNQRTTPILQGEVFYVSADAVQVQNGFENREIYLARVKLPASEIARVHGFVPTPGMPAEILIQTAERTFFAYLTKPIADSMSRAFNER